MIDIHCHILPGLDDGPETIEQSLAMCRLAAADGIKTIVATPHFKPGKFEASSGQISEKIAELNVRLQQEGIDVAVLPGADVSVTPELRTYLQSESYLTINSSKPYFLAELSHDTIPPRWDTFLLSFLKDGYVPILTHPERNPWFVHHPDALFAFVLQGGLIQITAMSITGGCGDICREFSKLLLKHNLVHAIATDAHDEDVRPPVLSAAVSAAAKIIGQERASALVTTMPKAIIEGRQVVAPELPSIVDARKRKSWLQIFSRL